MRRIVLIMLCFLLCFSLLSFCGCNKKTRPTPCYRCGNTSGMSSLQMCFPSQEYKTLEDYLTEADEILYATYTGKKEAVYIHYEDGSKKPCVEYDDYEYLIMKHPQIKGDTVFKVKITDYPPVIKDKNGNEIDGISFDQSAWRWEKGKTYILLLEKLETGEDDGIEKYTMLGDAVIPADGGEATLYSEPIEKHSTGYTGEGDIAEYLRNFLENGE